MYSCMSSIVPIEIPDVSAMTTKRSPISRAIQDIATIGNRVLNRGLHQLDRDNGVDFVDLGWLQFLCEHDDDFFKEEDFAILTIED